MSDPRQEREPELERVDLVGMVRLRRIAGDMHVEVEIDKGRPFALTPKDARMLAAALAQKAHEAGAR